MRLGDRDAGPTVVTRDAVRRALERGEFRAHFQPIVALASGAPVGYEALARWQHPAGGVLRPAAFFAALERADLAVPFGWQILAAVWAEVAARGHADGAGAAFVTVNVSVAQFAPSPCASASRDSRMCRAW